MPSSYTGSPTALELPSPAPAPGALPIVSRPSDGDDLDAASVEQMAKVGVDFIAHVQSAARIEVPQTPSPTAGVSRAFTSVTHTGPGSGTVKPSAGTSLFGHRYRVEITTAGGLGVGAFKLSLDGGLTFGAITAIPGGGVWVDASDVTLTFAGTFTLADTYDFRGCDTPLHLWQAADGKARELIDHNGYALAKVSSFREDWSHGIDDVFAPGSTAAYFPGYARWQYTLSTDTPDPAMSLVQPASDGLGNFSTLLCETVGATVLQRTSIFGKQAVVTFGATSNAVAEFEAAVRVPGGGADSTIWIGLNNDGLFRESVGQVFLAFKATTGGNWFARIVSQTTLHLNADTGIGPSTGPGADYQLLRIEWYGPESTVGAAMGGVHVVRFLIDGEQAAYAELATGDLSGLGRAAANAENDATGNDDSIELGPISWAVNWFNNPTKI